MQLTISVEDKESKGGTALAAPAIGLTGYGKTSEQAEAMLRSGIEAWCRSLKKAGRLDEALGRLEVLTVSSGQRRLEIVLE